MSINSTLRVMETEDDIAHGLHLGRLFYEAGPHAGDVDFVEADVELMFRNMVADPSQVVFIDDNSMIGGLLSPFYFNKACLIAHEAFWFSTEKGTSVRKAFERWAERMGAKKVVMTCLADSHEKGMRRLLRMQGYEAKEVSFLKDL